MNKTLILAFSASLASMSVWADVDPTQYSTQVGEGNYYLYNVESAQFINPTVNAPALVNYDKALPTTLTAVDGTYRMTGVAGKYLKIGVYRGQYLWSDGDSSATYWTFIPTDASDNSYRIATYFGNYTEASLDGDWYLTGSNATNDADIAGTYVVIDEDGYARMTNDYMCEDKRKDLFDLIEQASDMGLDTSLYEETYSDDAATLEALTNAIQALSKEIADYQENSVSPDAPRDVTSQWIPNATFDSNFEGWTSTTNSKNNQVNANIDETTKNGKLEGGVWENWTNTTFQGKMYRSMTGLPNGVYKLQLDAFAWNPVNQYVYANRAKTPILSKLAETYEVYTSISDHALECGLLAADNSNGWMGMDNVKLLYYGSSKESYLYLADIRRQALTDYEDKTYTASYLTAIQDKLNQINSATGLQEMDSIIQQAQTLQEALDTNIAAYITLSELKDKVDLLSSNVNDHYAEILYDDLTNIEDALSEQNLSNDDLSALIEQLNEHIDDGNSCVKLTAELESLIEQLKETLADYSSKANPSAVAQAEEVQEKAEEAALNMEITNEEVEELIASIQESIAALKVPMGEADDNNPIDYTSYITNPSFDNDDDEGWEGTSTGHAQKVQAAEFWNCNFDFHQDIANLPDGVYTISMQGFYRAGWNKDEVYEAWKDGSQPINSFVYAESENGRIIIPMKSIWEEARNAEDEGALGQGSETLVQDMYAPNDMTSAVAYFGEGRYTNEITIRVTGGKLTIGLFKENLVKEDWTIFDNWQLTFYGADSKRIETETTGIETTVPTVAKATEGIFDLQGRRLNTLQRGINIIRQSDGTVRKVMVK